MIQRKVGARVPPGAGVQQFLSAGSLVSARGGAAVALVLECAPPTL